MKFFLVRQCILNHRNSSTNQHQKQSKKNKRMAHQTAHQLQWTIVDQKKILLRCSVFISKVKLLHRKFKRGWQGMAGQQNITFKMAIYMNLFIVVLLPGYLDHEGTSLGWDWFSGIQWPFFVHTGCEIPLGTDRGYIKRNNLAMSIIQMSGWFSIKLEIRHTWAQLSYGSTQYLNGFFCILYFHLFKCTTYWLINSSYLET